MLYPQRPLEFFIFFFGLMNAVSPPWGCLSLFYFRETYFSPGASSDALAYTYGARVGSWSVVDWGLCPTGELKLNLEAAEPKLLPSGWPGPREIIAQGYATLEGSVQEGCGVGGRRG